MIASLLDLRPETRAAAEQWLDQTRAGLPFDVADAVIDEMEIVLCQELDDDATMQDLDRVIAGFGDVDGTASTRGLHGTVFGVPYDLRIPTADRLKDTLWNPASDTIFVPRAFGAGWDLNFGAVAVRLGLIEPDAEDDPFTSTPQWAFQAAIGIPAALAAAVVAHYAVRYPTLAKRLPAHWNLTGKPDRWISKRRAAFTDIAVALAGAGLGAASTRTQDTGSKAGLLAAGAVSATLAALVTVERPRGADALAGAKLVAGMAAAAGGTLLGLAFLGRRAEQQRDLGGGSK